MGTSLRELNADVYPIAQRFVREAPAQLGALLGIKLNVRINSVRRDQDEQQQLYANFLRCGCSSCSPNRSGCYPVAKPGSSPHALGIAWDMNVEPRYVRIGRRRVDLLQLLGLLWQSLGFRWGGVFSQPDPVHFDFHPPGYTGGS